MTKIKNKSKKQPKGATSIQNTSKKKSTASTKKDNNRSLNLMNLMVDTQGTRVVDSETLIKETQKRVWASLKKGYEYTGMIDESDLFLRAHVFSRINMVILYVDLIGSTQMTLELPEEKLAIIFSCFVQEMSSVIKQHSGFVLKFVGDAVIGYFVAGDNSLRAADKAVMCAKSMIDVIKNGINPILNQYDYPDLAVKIGMDYGENIIVRYGSDEVNSHVDILGPPMNIAAKIQNLAKTNQILIGYDVYNRLHPSIQESFRVVVWKHREWKYHSRVTGDLYNVYEYQKSIAPTATGEITDPNSSKQ